MSKRKPRLPVDTDWLKARFVDLDLTSEEVAELAGVSKFDFSKRINGVTAFTLADAVLLSDLFGLSMAETAIHMGIHIPKNVRETPFLRHAELRQLYELAVKAKETALAVKIDRVLRKKYGAFRKK
jgi:plasmid maintenance system antidote protein VapI